MDQHGTAAPADTGLRIAVTGSSGLIGAALIERLSAGGHFPLRLVRHKAELPGEVFWQPGPGPRGGQIEEKGLEGIDVAVHLAGEPPFVGRWTERKKQTILN